jgi:hypothetical protein
METTNSTPKLPSITIIGWSTIVASALMIVINLVSLLSSTMFDDLGAGFNSPLLSQYVPQSMNKVMDLYRYSRWLTWFEICFFAFALVAAFQFLQLRAWGRDALEIVCWIGLLNAFLESGLSYLIWKNMQESLSMVLRGVGGSQYSSLNPIGFATIIVGFFLWVIPSVGMIVYLRRPIIRQVVSLR